MMFMAWYFGIGFVLSLIAFVVWAWRYDARSDYASDAVGIVIGLTFGWGIVLLLAAVAAPFAGLFFGTRWIVTREKKPRKPKPTEAEPRNVKPEQPKPGMWEQPKRTER